MKLRTLDAQVRPRPRPHDLSRYALSLAPRTRTQADAVETITYNRPNLHDQRINGRPTRGTFVGPGSSTLSDGRTECFGMGRKGQTPEDPTGRGSEAGNGGKEISGSGGC